MRGWKLTAMGLLLAPLGGLADEQKDKDAQLPVVAKLVAKKAAYRLDLGGKTAAEFRQLLKDGEASGKLPEPPAVDLALELTNTSDKEVKVWVKGDPVVLELELQGPGAVSVAPKRPFTTELRAPAPAVLPPGRSYTYPIRGLKYGFRGVEKQAYWVEPGEYTLTANFKTALAPAPPGTKDENGFGRVTLTSDPVQIKVEGK